MWRFIQRTAISLFVIAHLCAVTIWILPACVIKLWAIPYIVKYMVPLGQWQYWGMFAPDPMRDTMMLEAAVVDARGLLHTFAFPKEKDFGAWGSSLHYRHSKYAANFALKEEFKAHREFAARHAVRQLGMTADMFPVDVQLMYRIKPTPPPGSPPPDPMMPLAVAAIDTYRFPSLKEVQP